MRWTFGIPNPYTSQRISKMGSENDEVKTVWREDTPNLAKFHDLEVTFVQTFGIEIAAESAQVVQDAENDLKLSQQKTRENRLIYWYMYDVNTKI